MHNWSPFNLAPCCPSLPYHWRASAAKRPPQEPRPRAARQRQRPDPCELENTFSHRGTLMKNTTPEEHVLHQKVAKCGRNGMIAACFPRCGDQLQEVHLDLRLQKLTLPHLPWRHVARILFSRIPNQRNSEAASTMLVWKSGQTQGIQAPWKFPQEAQVQPPRRRRTCWIVRNRRCDSRPVCCTELLQ